MTTKGKTRDRQITGDLNFLLSRTCFCTPMSPSSSDALPPVTFTLRNMAMNHDGALSLVVHVTPFHEHYYRCHSW